MDKEQEDVMTRPEVIGIVVLQAKALIAGYEGGFVSRELTDNEADFEAIRLAERILKWCRFMREAPQVDATHSNWTNFEKQGAV